MADEETTREVLHRAISESTPWRSESSEDDAEVPDSGVLTGWMLVAEWQGDDGFRWLSKLSANALGSQGLPQWHERGFCHEVAYHWPEGDGS